MAMILSRLWPSAVAFVLFVALCSLSDCYDPLDPDGKITVSFDILYWRSDGYVARVTIQNFYQYHHVDELGWKLGWTWAENEVIWSMRGAFAAQQGNCSSFKFDIPHSCKKDPLILDLMPDAPHENRSDDCCHGGLLSARAIDPSKSFSSFEITVGNLPRSNSEKAPLNLTFMAPGPGYSCSQLVDTDPTTSSDNDGRREVQVFRTWKSTCSYSPFLAKRTPVCCASLSTFYNPEITSCPKCSCGCRDADQSTISCLRESYPATTATDFSSNLETVQCTDHMCPIRVHWHIKNNYVHHWRIKLTVSNYNFGRNYSNWNILVQHPGFSQSATAFSLNTTLISSTGFGDELALFWGIKYYNEELPHGDEYSVGAVTSEILLEKDLESFTLRNGWGFPRKIYFNGENCEMPLPDIFPMLPNAGSFTSYNKLLHIFLHFLLLLISFTFNSFFPPFD